MSYSYREAALNWLALGLLLGAWNAADDRQHEPQRPAKLSAYPQFSVRSATRAAVIERGFTVM